MWRHRNVTCPFIPILWKRSSRPIPLLPHQLRRKADKSCDGNVHKSFKCGLKSSSRWIPITRATRVPSTAPTKLLQCLCEGCEHGRVNGGGQRMFCHSQTWKQRWSETWVPTFYHWLSLSFIWSSPAWRLRHITHGCVLVLHECNQKSFQFWSSQYSILGLSIERMNASVHFSVTTLSLLGTWHACPHVIPSYRLRDVYEFKIPFG